MTPGPARTVPVNHPAPRRLSNWPTRGSGLLRHAEHDAVAVHSGIHDEQPRTVVEARPDLDDVSLLRPGLDPDAIIKKAENGIVDDVRVGRVAQPPDPGADLPEQTPPLVWRTSYEFIKLTPVRESPGALPTGCTRYSPRARHPSEPTRVCRQSD